MKKALITGITGQDGSYLAELLLEKGYEVHGIIRRSSTFNTQRIDHLYQDPHVNGVRLFLHYGDMADSSNLMRIVHENIVFSLAVKFGILILSALGLTNMWWAVFGDVGVLILATLNAMRCMIRVKE